MASGFLWSLFQWIGVAYLAWLGVKLLIRKETLSLNANTDATVPARAFVCRGIPVGRHQPQGTAVLHGALPAGAGSGARIGLTGGHPGPDILRPIHPVPRYLFGAGACVQNPFHDAKKV